MATSDIISITVSLHRAIGGRAERHRIHPEATLLLARRNGLYLQPVLGEVKRHVRPKADNQSSIRPTEYSVVLWDRQFRWRSLAGGFRAKGGGNG